MAQIQLGCHLTANLVNKTVVVFKDLYFYFVCMLKLKHQQSLIGYISIVDIVLS